MCAEFTRRRILAAILLLVMVGALAHRIIKARINESCAENLRRIGTALAQYSERAKGEYYPSLSFSPGRILFDASCVYPDHLSDPTVFISPAHPKARELRKRAAVAPESAIDDTSYWYLGYMIIDERSALAWINHYNNYIHKRQEIPNFFEVWPDCVESVHEREERWNKTRERKRGTNTMMYNPLAEPQFDELQLIQRLRAGVERYAVREIMDPTAGQRAASRVPVMIERPELHGDGGHVLFMDGHVEFRAYPGPYPMTVDFIKGLRELDQLTRYPHTRYYTPGY